MGESYEQLRDEAAGEGAQAWREADRDEANLRALYRSLKDDPRYTEEHKAEKAWEAYDAASEKIAAGKAKARELLQRQARAAERSSLPFPGGEGPVTVDTAKLIASQNEAARVVRRVERRQKAPGPFKADVPAILSEEYGRGLEAGGMQGAAVCRGVLAAADELGVDKHAVVEGLRKDRHRESLGRAEHSERLSRLIGKGVEEPPFARPGRGRKSPGVLLVPGRQAAPEPAAPRAAGRRRPWK